MKRVHLKIEGRVQGVFYRANTQRTAVGLGLSGYVMNKDDGSVEAVAEGSKEQLDKLIEWCKKGPTGSYVSEVKISEEPATGEFKSFIIRY